DTTLHGLSGESIKFQNSTTYRYQEYEVDENGNLTIAGVTREISTGIFLDITGWISGDNMITMEINSTLSKEGTGSSSSAATLPPTSERVINTHIRTPSGTPIVIGGLNQKELSTQIEKVPLLGDIPLIGFLFRKTSTTEENTELVIYIVPYLDMGDSENIEPEEEINRLFNRFFL
nr:type II and III secretion system protein [Spirochaetaceae bacterium]